MIRMHKVSVETYQRSVRVQVNLVARYLRDLTRHYGSQDLALLSYNGNLTGSPGALRDARPLDPLTSPSDQFQNHTNGRDAHND